MPFFNFFSYLVNINATFRAFVLGSVFSIYALFLYYFQNEISLGLSNLSYLFVIPFVLSCVVLIILPKKYDSVLLKTNKNNKLQDNSHATIENNTALETPKNYLNQKVSESLSEQKPKIEKTFELEKEVVKNNATDSKLSESFNLLKKTVSDYEKKISDFEKQIHDMRVTLQDLKRSGVIKNDNYESALTELKAFKSELDNPFNFINKYFEMLDIPGMYDQKTSVKPNGSQSAYEEHDLEKKLNMIPTKKFEHQDSKPSAKSNVKHNDKKNKNSLLPEKNNGSKNHNEEDKFLKPTKNKSNKENKMIFKPRKVNVIG